MREGLYFQDFATYDLHEIVLLDFATFDLQLKWSLTSVSNWTNEKEKRNVSIT